MISVLINISDKDFEKGLNEAKRLKRDPNAALGYLGEQIVKGVFEGKGEATTASGKADIQGVPPSVVASLIKKAEPGVVEASIVSEIQSTMGVSDLDIEAKFTLGQLAPGKSYEAAGQLKLTQATPTVAASVANDPDYIYRQKLLITELIRIGLGNTALITSVENNFKELQELSKVTQKDVKAFQDMFISAVGGVEGLNNLFESVLKNNWNEFMNGPFGIKLKNKARNLTAQVNVSAPQGKTLRFFQTFVGLKFNNNDIGFSYYDKNSAGIKTYKFFFTSGFERKLLAETRKKLEQNAILSVDTKNIRNLGFKAGAKTELGALLGSAASIDKLKFSVSIPTGGSIPLDFVVDASALLNTISKDLPRSLTPKRSKQKTGQFISAVTMTKLLQDVTKSRMRKGGEPTPPTLTYRSGRFIENLRVAQVNYRNSIIRYYSNPIYYSLEQYGYDVSEMIEGSLRSITQNLYSRQFKLIRGDI
jgi:hypothetical protein